MDFKKTSWFKYTITAAAAVLVTVIMLTIFVLIRLDSTLWQQYSLIDSIRLIYDDFYAEGYIHYLIISANAVILIAILVQVIIAILSHYDQSIKDIKNALNKDRHELARKKQKLDDQGRELKEKRQRYIDQVANVETKCRKLEKRIGGLRGRIKQIADMLQEEQPQIGKVRSLVEKTYKAKGESIEATDSELGRLRAENELLYAEKAQLREDKVQLKKNMKEMEEEVGDLQYDKEHLQKNLEKYVEADERRKKKGGRKKK